LDFCGGGIETVQVQAQVSLTTNCGPHILVMLMLAVGDRADYLAWNTT
jgi:hypothetical protein